MEKLIKNETIINIWSMARTEKTKRRVKDEVIYFEARFIDFGIINLGINGMEQGVIYSYTDDNDRDCLGITNLDAIEIL